MAASTHPAMNSSPPMPTILRGKKDQRLASGSIVDLIPKSTLGYLGNAIRVGDRLPNPTQVEPAKRRALIVAPQYWENHPGAQYAELPFTINDAFHIHQMLVQHGYEPKNIRILADCFEPDGLSDPSGEHINKSLDWLVEGARPGDYRFFHFAGHGTRLDSEKGKGKQARVVSVERGNDSEPSGPHGRVRKQTIPKNELTYFNEAIVASYRPPPWYVDVSQEEYSLIRDKKLNEVFARLPQGCVLTCVLDCCCSGRLIGNNTKLAGGGFRGKKTATQVVASEPLPPRVLNSINTQMLHIPTSEEPQTEDILTPNGNNVIMFEELPGDEKARDHIKALVITWSACHQRQEAGEIPDSKSGILTRAFTQTVASMTRIPDNPPPSLEAVFDQVETLVRKDASNLEVPSNEAGKLPEGHVQYAQVWTSLGNDEGAEAFERLKQPFVI
ncbi:hypothetical protein BDV93DRAFT_345954 [Ceratobasidium sp. AG-I]|nr:hypothetical protein BDV93DRAFT_345954 [Ceratobasidium sp. AG-I]